MSTFRVNWGRDWWMLAVPLAHIIATGIANEAPRCLVLRKGQGPFRVLSDFKTAAERPWHPLKDVNPGNGNAPGAAELDLACL